jgi:hypothetical protein
MRKLIVSNFQTLDGYYESTSKTFDRFFDYWHEEYGVNKAFDEYNTEMLRGAGTLLLSGRTSFLANKDYWVSYPDAPGSTAIRLEFAELISVTEKYVVSDTITRKIWPLGRTPPESSVVRTSTPRSPPLRRDPGAPSWCS